MKESIDLLKELVENWNDKEIKKNLRDNLLNTFNLKLKRCRRFNWPNTGVESICSYPKDI